MVNMKLNVKVGLIQDNKTEKNYWLFLWRIGNNIDKITDIAQMFADGRIYTDEKVAGVIDGVNWRKSR